LRLSRISISLRLTLWFASIFLLGWVTFGAAMWLILKHSLTQERHSTLVRRLNRLQELVMKVQGEDQTHRIQDFKDFAHATGNGLSEILRADGSHYFPSPSAAAQAFPWPAIDDSKTEIFQRVNASGHFYWMVGRPWQLGSEKLYLMAAAPSISDMDILDAFSSGLLASAPLLFAVSSLGGYLLSRRALRPVDRITVTARSISIRNLSERLPNATSSDELHRLTETFNAMLERLESAVGQIKQFTADASHELRGPLSFVRTVAEVALRNPRIDTESREAFTDIVSEVAKSAVLLEDMLTLARADARSADAVLEALDVAPVLRNAYERALPIATERGLSLTCRIPADEAAWAIADELTLRRLFWILLDNAIKYTPAPGTIAVSLSSVNTDLLIEVSDTGVGIPAADLPFIFNRFYRADPSRGQTEGSGLGLAIAKWIADLHGCTLSVFSEIDEGTTVLLRFPVSTSTSSSLSW
jgi:heavy metal sensor kinase